WTPPGLPYEVIPQSRFYAPVYGPTTLQNDPQGNKYAYAPSVVLDTAGHYNIYSCANQRDGVITDSIEFLRRDVNGVQTYQQFIQAPSPSPAWDENHNCDPSMIKGSFNFNGTNYLYANFYTGNYYGCGANGNAVGVSFSNSQPSTYVKTGVPLIPHTGATCDWGTGQPSAVSADGGGNGHLFYTDHGCKMSEVDLSNANSPVVSAPIQVSQRGLLNANGQADYLRNCDFAYDATRNRYYMTRDSNAANPLSETEVL